jgi:glycerol dehydrogenase
MVVAAGGGKALDTGKLLAEALWFHRSWSRRSRPPTPPRAALPSLYTEEHAQPGLSACAPTQRWSWLTPPSWRVPRCASPSRGWATPSHVARGRTCAATGGGPVGVSRRAALALAEPLPHGPGARAAGRKDVAAGRVGDAVEAVVEANTLLSGLGFESGSRRGAQSGRRTQLAARRIRYLHGEGRLRGVSRPSWEDWPAAERQELLSFYRDGYPGRSARSASKRHQQGSAARRRGRMPAGIAHAQSPAPGLRRGTRQCNGRPPRLKRFGTAPPPTRARPYFTRSRHR